MRFASIVAAAASVSFFAACSAPPPAGDDAESSGAAATTSTWGAGCGGAAVDITAAVAGGGAFHGTTIGSSLGLSTCGDRTGPAVVLKYQLPSYGNYRVDVTSALPANHPSASSAAVVVRSDCEHLMNEIACNDKAASTSTFVGFHVTQPIYIRVEGDFYAQGFDLTVTKLALECRTNADCKDWPNGSCNQLNGNCISKLACRGSRGNCDGNWENGCEADLDVSAANCGACGAKCDATGGNATSATCSAGKCTLGCNAGFADCDGSPKTGCEAELARDGLTCGACGNSCGGGVCAGGACATRGEEIATIPGLKKTGDAYSINHGVNKLAVSKNAVIALDDSYIGKGYAVPHAGGAPVLIGGGEDMSAVPWSDDVWFTSVFNASYVKDSGAGATTVKRGRFEEARVGGFDGTTFFLLEESVASTPTTTPASVRSLRVGDTASTMLWQAPPTKGWGRLQGPAITPTKVVIRPVGYSGYAYNAYSPKLLVIDRATGVASELAATARGMVFTADESGVYYGGDGGVWFAAYTGAPPQQLFTAKWVSSIVLDGADLYFTAGEHCSLYDKRAGRIYRMPKTGGAPTELAYDRFGPGVGSFDSQCYAWAGQVIGVNKTHVFWSSEDRIRRIAK